MSKPWTTYDDQLLLLKSRGMAIANDDEAIQLLRSVGYYRLSAYWYSMRMPRMIGSNKLGGTPTDQFYPGSSFTQVRNTWDFDRRLKLIMWEAIERIEILLRTSIAHTIGATDPFGYLDPEKLHAQFSKHVIRTEKDKNNPNLLVDKTRHSDWLFKLEELIDRSKEDFVTHHQRKLDPRLPIWVAAELFDFGQTSKLYAGLSHRDKELVSSSLGVDDPSLLVGWTRSMNFARNTIGHHGRLWNKNFTDVPPSPKTGTIPELDHLRREGNVKRLFGVATVISYLAHANFPEAAWNAEFKSVLDSFATTSTLLSPMGFPEDWHQHLIWGGGQSTASNLVLPASTR